MLHCALPFLATDFSFTCKHPRAASLVTPRSRPFMSCPTWERVLKPQSPPASNFQRLDTPTLLGHPHEQASPQETEPFWQQQPEIAYPYARFYPELDLYTEHQVYILSSNMDVANVVIGSKSRFARSVSVNEAPAPPKPKRPRETVKIYLQDHYVGEISFGVLIRFSKLAKVTFPRSYPTTNEHEKSSDGNKVKAEVGQTEAPTQVVPDSKNWAEMAEQSDISQIVKSQDPSDHPTTTTEPSVKSVTSPPPKELIVGVNGVWVQPEISTLKFILMWMEQNKRTRQDEPLLPITPQPMSKISLTALVDTYTGALAYDLAPFPRELRHEILSRLTKQPTKLEQIRHIYVRLPLDEPILSRMVTSFFEHSEAGNYTKQEVDAIYEYVHEKVDDEGVLEHHFDRVKRSRARKQTRESAMEKLRQQFENFAGPVGEALDADGGQENGEQEKVVPKDEEGHRRRNRREQKQGHPPSKSAGVKGKAV